MSLKKLAHVVYVIKFLEIEFFILFTYCPFNVCRISSDRSSVISGTSNLYLLSFFLFCFIFSRFVFSHFFVFLGFFKKIAVYVIFYLFKKLVIGKFLFLDARHFQVAINILEIYSAWGYVTWKQSYLLGCWFFKYIFKNINLFILIGGNCCEKYQ